MSDLVGNPEDRFSQNEAQLPRLGEREVTLSAIDYTSNYVVSVQRGFLLHLVLMIGLLYFTVALPVPSI